LAEDSRVQEPVVDRWSDEAGESRKKRRPASLGPSIFCLSGGVMKSRAGNEIDLLLARMLQAPDTEYIPNIDRNLDCLFTSLRLEMIKPDVVRRDREL